MLTPFHAKYYANELLHKKSYNNEDRLSASLFDAALTINPHQIDAALFAFKSPLSKGVLLADEVGLGKTIEAGLVMCQLWAERKRKQMVICPASLRKQWSLELLEKFNLKSVILESKTYNEYKKAGMLNPYDQTDVVITSYNYASKMNTDISCINWDLVIIDEAHKLRNSYRTSNKIGQGIKAATAGRKKLLLTATPLQNSLIELYGLSTIIDEHLFGDIKSFRENYVNNEDPGDLKERLSHFCKRTLRKDVIEYTKFTERLPIVQQFTASNEEQALYEAISTFLQAEDTYAVPARQKQLTSLIIRKLLASSTWAVLQTLETIKERLEKIREGLATVDSELENMVDEDELAILEESLDELDQDDEEIPVSTVNVDMNKLQAEIELLDSFINMAKKISVDTKSRALLDAIEIGFSEMHRLGANKKALIFTESRRTQEYLKRFLEAHGYAGKIVLFNGSNSGKEITDIYKTWYDRNKYTGRISGSANADKRNAIIEYFRDTAEILIATESAAEGVNLQFCSMVINYDLPWNPQRIEQRIGRCHRYGQKSDVVVINFINKRNSADLRVHELLDEKFNLFRGVFGSSDEVLGAVESGVDFERKILEIYQKCRTPEEIEAEFNLLQKQLEEKINQSMQQTRDLLFKNFDSEVHDRLKLSINEYMDRYSRLFWNLTKYILDGQAEFDDEAMTFNLDHRIEGSEPGIYTLISKKAEQPEGNLYRLSHPLGQYVLTKAINTEANCGKVTFDISNHQAFKISQVEQLKGQSGYLTLYKYSINSFDSEDHLLFCGLLKDGQYLEPEQCKKLFECGGSYLPEINIPSEITKTLSAEIDIYANGTLERAKLQNLQFVKEEEERLEKWTNDMILALEKELSNVKLQIRDCERKLRIATSTDEHLELQTRLLDLNKRKRTMRSRLEENEEEIIEKRQILINEIKKRMQTSTELAEIFTIKWEVI